MDRHRPGAPSRHRRAELGCSTSVHRRHFHDCGCRWNSRLPSSAVRCLCRGVFRRVSLIVGRSGVERKSAAHSATLRRSDGVVWGSKDGGMRCAFPLYAASPDRAAGPRRQPVLPSGGTAGMPSSSQRAARQRMKASTSRRMRSASSSVYFGPTCNAAPRQPRRTASSAANTSRVTPLAAQVAQDRLPAPPGLGRRIEHAAPARVGAQPLIRARPGNGTQQRSTGAAPGSARPRRCRRRQRETVLRPRDRRRPGQVAAEVTRAPAVGASPGAPLAQSAGARWGHGGPARCGGCRCGRLGRASRGIAAGAPPPALGIQRGGAVSGRRQVSIPSMSTWCRQTAPSAPPVSTISAPEVPSQ